MTGGLSNYGKRTLFPFVFLPTTPRNGSWVLVELSD
nr:MAG TPA: hypothetical protein [Caudoviricetes sp.]DAR05292.1 MAG TPA: hypothetical protein [Caudoviricetes sp.]